MKNYKIALTNSFIKLMVNEEVLKEFLEAKHKQGEFYGFISTSNRKHIIQVDHIIGFVEEFKALQSDKEVAE